MTMEQTQRIVMLVSFAGALAVTVLILRGSLPLSYAGPGVFCLASVGFVSNTYLKSVR